MKEIHDPAELHHYLELHQISHVFNPDVMPHLFLCQFEQGEQICKQGEPARWVYVLVKGKIKIFTTSPEGRSLILSFKKPLEAIGDVEYVQQADILNTVEAVTPVTMIGVSYRNLRQYSGNDPAMLRFLLEIISQKFYLKSASLSFNLLHPVEIRLASYLLSTTCDEADTFFGEPIRTVNLADIANLIGTSYRHLNRIIRQFCECGLLQRNKGDITVKNVEGLRLHAGQNIYE